MSKVVTFIAAVVIAVVPFLAAPNAAAEMVCEIGYTGPDSNNLCTSTETYICEVTNTNEVTITNQNGQEAYSGDVNVGGNTSSGGAVSGEATNTNGTTFSIIIRNPVQGVPGICTATVNVPATETPTTPTQPPAGGQGEVLSVTSLPNTASDIAGQVWAAVALYAVIVAGIVTGFVAMRRQSVL